MIRSKPKLKYCGLTIVLSNPSRYDKLNLLTSNSGHSFNDYLNPEFNVMQCDIRLMEDTTPFIEGTRCVLLLGIAAMHTYLNKETGNNTLNEMRGSPFYTNGIPAIASYLPQEAWDKFNGEAQYNSLAKNYEGNDVQNEFEDDDESEGDVKRHSPTRKSNYGFWLRNDVKKCKKLLVSGADKWPIEAQPIYKIWPSAQETMMELESHKNEYLYFDIETDFEEQNWLCFSFMFADSEFNITSAVYSYPILDSDYKPSSSFLHFIIRALCIAVQHNIMVGHNIAAFDCLVLAFKYNIPVYRIYDTLVAMQRCYPEVERSLGHAVSLLTYQIFHKDSAAHGYYNQQQVMDELKYCGKDVFTNYLVHRELVAFSRTIPGLTDSINCANRSLLPYLTDSIYGIRFNPEIVEKLKKENDLLMEQYLRIINILIGPEGLAICRKSIKGKAKSIPNSNTQCANYFHEQMEYPVVKRSEKTQKPSLGAKNMYKLALKHENPVITFILLFRATQKEYSTLKFHPWKDDDNKVIPYIKAE